MNANATLLWASSKGVGDPRRQPFGVASADVMVSGAKSLADGSGKSQPLGRDRQEPRGCGAVAVACEQPDRNRYLSFVEAGNRRLREQRWLLGPFPGPNGALRFRSIIRGEWE